MNESNAAAVRHLNTIDIRIYDKNQVSNKTLIRYRVLLMAHMMSLRTSSEVLT